MKKKSYWPLGLTLFIAAFILVKVGIVIFSLGINRDLVTTNYYEEEIAYQEQINRINHSNQLQDKMLIELQNSNHLFLEFPEDIAAGSIVGTIWMFRPDDKRSDKRIQVAVDVERRQWINVAGLKKGNWKVKILWNDGEVEYYNESPLFIN